jgi:hypothetical protein
MMSAASFNAREARCSPIPVIYSVTSMSNYKIKKQKNKWKQQQG